MIVVVHFVRDIMNDDFDNAWDDKVAWLKYSKAHFLDAKKNIAKLIHDEYFATFPIKMLNEFGYPTLFRCRPLPSPYIPGFEITTLVVWPCTCEALWVEFPTNHPARGLVRWSVPCIDHNSQT